VFERGDGVEDLEEHAADGGGGVDALVQDDEVDAALLQLLGQGDEVFQGAAEPVELGEHQLVALAQDEQGLVEFGTAGEFPGRLVDEDLFVAGGFEGVELGFGVLVAGGDPRGRFSRPDRNANGGRVT
jgi:hypothetical protein